MKLTYNMIKSNPLGSIAPLTYYTYHETEEGNILMRGSYLVLRKHVIQGEVPRDIRVTVEWDEPEQ